MNISKIIRILLALGMTSACATSFTGSAHVEDGRAGCERKCKGQGMELSGMVYMGEYSDACVCSTPGQTGSNEPTAGTVAGASAGVVMQMRRQQEQQQQQQQN